MASWHPINQTRFKARPSKTLALYPNGSGPELASTHSPHAAALTLPATLSMKVCVLSPAEPDVLCT